LKHTNILIRKLRTHNRPQTVSVSSGRTLFYYFVALACLWRRGVIYFRFQHSNHRASVKQMTQTPLQPMYTWKRNQLRPLKAVDQMQPEFALPGLAPVDPKYDPAGHDVQEEAPVRILRFQAFVY